MNAIAHTGHDFRASTDAAWLCGAIVKQTAKNIQGRKYVTVEGWQAIAIAHGCAASAMEVERVTDEGMSGFRCTGIVRRMSDGAEIARGEGFLGDDEATWNKRQVYARRAMVQTRAISRACRSAFAHVVVMIDAGLSTTPAEEVPDGGFVEGQFQDVTSGQQEPVDSFTFPPGPAKGITEMKSLARLLWREIEGCGDETEMGPLLDVTENAALMKQMAALENPAHLEIWLGDGKDNPGLAGLITRKQTEFAQRKADLMGAG